MPSPRSPGPDFMRRFELLLLYREEYDPIHPPDAIANNLPKEKQFVLFTALAIQLSDEA